jgi:hypothetical protein
MPQLCEVLNSIAVNSYYGFQGEQYFFTEENKKKFFWQAEIKYVEDGKYQIL